MKNLGCYFYLKVNLAIFITCILGFGFVLSMPALANSGQYLVATQAAGKKDFDTASKNFLSILNNDFSEEIVIQEALLFSVLANDVNAALKLSEISDKRDIMLPTVGLMSLVRFYKNKDFKRVYNLLSRYDRTLPTYLTILAEGWTKIANGSFIAGLETFSLLDGTNRYLGLYNCAIAFAMQGDFHKALPYLEELEGKKLKFDEMQLVALAQIYSNNNLNDKAISLLEDQIRGQRFNIFEEVLVKLRNRKKLKYDVFVTPEDALSNVFYLMGNTNDQIKTNPIAASFYIRLAEFLSVRKDFYSLRVAEIFADMGAFTYSTEKFDKVSREDLFYLRAQLGAADTLVRSGKDNSAKRILEQLIKEGFNEFVIYDSLADIFRANENYKEAIFYYDKALHNISEDSKNEKWATFFVRGISHDQSGDWKKAKDDFITALELSKDHPEVLNYFGYSLIERNENLEEALKMIESAVSQRPESGYIVDSLAWGLFKLGFYKEAIVPMERAIQLEPHDPIVNDHLGDVLWMIGRKREAAFQWQRALSFGPTLENEKKIKEKLKFGITDL